MNATDALEFIMAGASAVSIGTANFVNPRLAEEIVKGISAFMVENGISELRELVGAAVLR